MSVWIAPLFGWLNNWQAARRETAAAEHQLALAEINAGIRGGDTFLKRASFILAMSPLVLAVGSPEWAALVFARLALLPAWYVDVVMMIMVSLWGISTAKEVLPGMTERIVRAWRGKK